MNPSPPLPPVSAPRSHLNDASVARAPSLSGNFSPPATATRKTKPRSRLRRVSLLAGAVLVLGFAAWGAKQWLFTTTVRGEITAAVTRTDLPIVVTERGQLESARTVTAKCQVEGESSKIVFILPEGTRVKKGEVVVRFDADKIRRSVAEQEIKFQTADGKAKAAKEELDVQKNKAESEVAKAELALDLAKLDREKYLEGEYKVEVDDKKGAINLAERELKEAEEKLDGFRTFVKKGFGTPEQLALKELDVAKAKNNLERDKAKLMVLEKYTRRRQEVELTAKEKEAKRELARTHSTTRATIAKADTDHITSMAVAKLEKDQLERAKKQLEHVAIEAPQDGFVVYEQTRFWDPTTRVQVGGMVYYQQPVFVLPDLDSMQVKVKVHESKVKKLRVGQKATVRLEAFPGLVLHGTVEKVATLADSEGGWRGGGAKEFETILKIDDLPSGGGLKPGFTAEVSIEVNLLPGVLAVPIQAVAQLKDKQYAYVKTDDGVDRREVTLGENNEKFVEVRTGIEEGENVCLDARARAAAETQAGEKDGVTNAEQPAKTKSIENRK
jgi:HlyD family secretion protein